MNDPRNRGSLNDRFLLSSTFGLGSIPFASGTFGSIPPAAMASGMWLVGLGPVETPVLFAFIFLVITSIFCVATIVEGDLAEARFGGDPSMVVADETAGMALTLALLVPAALVLPAPPWAWATIPGAAFVLFRAFDVLKPFPADQLQSLPSGWGILLDDLAAAVQAALTISLGWYLIGFIV